MSEITRPKEDTPDTPAIEPLLVIDKHIDESDSAALRARWEFGQLLVAARDGNGRLPNGYLAALVEATGKGRSELNNRSRFAQKYPTEAELSNALDSFVSWREVVQSLGGGSTDGEKRPVNHSTLTLVKWLDDYSTALEIKIKAGDIDLESAQYGVAKVTNCMQRIRDAICA